jgi:glycosyltransferase involved in cell wall biosynthesis
VSSTARPTAPFRVAVSGAHSSPYSGAAVVHRELAARLPTHLPNAEIIDDFRLDEGIAQRLRGSRRSFTSDVCITTSTPLPIRTAPSTMAIVYDVRWRWTRSVPARLYRGFDLHRTARLCDRVFTISQTVADQLRVLRVAPPGGVTVLRLGPGQFDGLPVRAAAGRDRTVVLVGKARHKRNELAASLLVDSVLVRRNFRVLAISVSAETAGILRAGLRTEQLQIVDGVDRTSLFELLAGASTYLALGTSEGFGFPYLEAAYAGCDVVMPMQPLAIELMADAACILESPDPTVDEIEDALERWDLERVRRLQAMATGRSWDDAAQQVASCVRSD